MAEPIMQGSDFQVAAQFSEYPSNQAFDLSGGVAYYWLKQCVTDGPEKALIRADSTTSPDDFELSGLADGKVIAIVRGSMTQNLPVKVKGSFVLQIAVKVGPAQYRAVNTEIDLLESVIDSI